MVTNGAGYADPFALIVSEGSEDDDEDEDEGRQRRHNDDEMLMR